MSSETTCPQCGSEHGYSDGALMNCPDCGHVWNPEETARARAEAGIIRDANGTVLANGDTVSVIKDLKIKGASQGIKAGTKVKNIRLVLDAADGHDLACKISGIGAINLKSEFVKKS